MLLKLKTHDVVADCPSHSGGSNKGGGTDECPGSEPVIHEAGVLEKRLRPPVCSRQTVGRQGREDTHSRLIYFELNILTSINPFVIIIKVFPASLQRGS